MNAIRQIIRSENGKIMIEVPKYMENQSFEVIIMPLENVDESTLNILKVSNNKNLKAEFWKNVDNLQNEAVQNGLTEELLADILSDE